MSKELQEAFQRYKNTFKDDFPTIPLAETREDEEIIEIINECVEQKKDVYELGYVSDDDNIQY